MKLKSMAWVLAALMCGAAIAGEVWKPRGKGRGIDLETSVPTRFADWTEVKDQNVRLIDPRTKKLLTDIYDQLLERSYVNRDGYRIMLSMAYGSSDQRGGLQAHRPEVCYPSQGFKLESVEDVASATAFGDVAVSRLTTSMGARQEPVTYWYHVSRSAKARATTWVARRRSSSSMCSSARLALLSSTVRGPQP